MIKRENETSVTLELHLRPVLARYSAFDRVGNPIVVHRQVIPKDILYAQLRPQPQPAPQGEQPEQQQQQQEQPGQPEQEQPQPGEHPQQQGNEDPNGGHTA